MLAQVTHVLPLTTIRRERVLPVPGNVSVRAGQKVTATDVIAVTRLFSQHLVLDISRGLGAPAEEVEQFISRKVDEEVSEGDVIAGPVGVFRRVIRSPKKGRIVAIGGGQVLIELDTNLFELKAGISGQVVSLIPDRGAVVETTGALIQGVWGNGRIDSGVLGILARSPNDELTVDRVDVSMRGTILLAGPCKSAETMKAMSEVTLRGLILSSMPAELIPLAMALPYPVILLEGFGIKPINSAAFQIISSNDKRDITLNASVWNRYQNERPEVVIPLPAIGDVTTPRDVEEFTPGQLVRLHRMPATSIIGTLFALRPGLTLFPSGIHAPAAEVQLENGEKTLVPLDNLEVII